MPRRYLQPSELPTSLAESLGDDAELQIARATTRVERELLTAIYDTDSAGLPTHPEVLSGIQAAIVLQLKYWLETGDSSGAVAQTGGGGSIGPISLPSSGGGTPTGVSKQEARTSPEVYEHLRTIGEPDIIRWAVSY